MKTGRGKAIERAKVSIRKINREIEQDKTKYKEEKKE